MQERHRRSAAPIIIPENTRIPAVLPSPAITENTHLTHELNIADDISTSTTVNLPPIPTSVVSHAHSNSTYATKTSLQSALITQQQVHPFSADAVIDCCDHKFQHQIAYDEITSHMINRYDRKVIEWHKYRFIQTYNNKCIINMQADDICANGGRCKYYECTKIHHISQLEICSKYEQCEIFEMNEQKIVDSAKDDNKKCNLIHIHSQRMVDRIASVLLFEKINHPALNDKHFNQCWIYFNRFVQLYEELYGEKFTHLVYEMNTVADEQWKNKIPENFINVALFLMEYGKFMVGNEVKQLWNIRISKHDIIPHITFDEKIVSVVCADHMTKSGCQYKPLYFCPYLHLDVKFVSF